ncbi:hypothetical protein FEM48_Zijuj06G0107400 [Ziziphus jujuba var. spinosa]|uniref:Uncharacterized protein n=1 Tax=Ziziphus jujuba var. spinosa TaxID=714518 RepID=A0A978V8U0_ZIZJJ|nr:hypothetical protein FEM48_Zijuj06G0107400 [Ziziphus jujuba var. spinosa]
MVKYYYYYYYYYYYHPLVALDLVAVDNLHDVQTFSLESIGVIFYASFLSGILIAVPQSVTEILVVNFYKESFKPEKGVLLVLSLLGSASYLFGEMKESKKTAKPRNRNYSNS